MKVNQPSMRPTNKVTAFMLAASASAITKALVLGVYPQFDDPLIWEPLPLLMGFVFAYFVRDRANT